MSIRDSVCVVGGVLLGFGISYRMLRLQSVHLKQLQELQANVKQLENKQYQHADRTKIIETTMEEHKHYEKTITKQLQNKLEEIQTHQTELGKAETDDKKALERKFEEIQNSLKREEAKLVERSRELNHQRNTSLKPIETQLKLLEEKCDSLEQMKDEVYTISVKIDRLTEEIEQINKRMESSSHEESQVEVKEESICKGLRGNYQTSNQSSISSQHDVEEDRSIDIFRFDILILHANKDQREANECKRFLMHNFPDICNLQVALPEDLLAPGTQLLPGLSTLLDSCRLVFIYVTENLESDPVAGYGKQVNFIQSLKDPLKEDRIIPLQLNEENISVDLCTVQPLEYVKDTTDRQFPDFKLQFENLVKFWKTKLP
ncbi:uncharacterized protein LOC127724240 isoform X2 [Mytilus californianus]|uniref:uncharacterized protein LOC127724240 isoform X2 n=1 Tax=Mytilus californianus TaxID=6549 RepID=UPI0022472C8C|nr:uncharacterized protein LOC127724240 isoform X2 [Mytilus californianus]